MGIYRELVAAATAIILLVVAVFIGLAVFHFNQIRSGLERERLAVISDRVAAPFETAASIGLPLSTVRNVEPILERALQTDSAIIAVHLLGVDGQTLATTSESGPSIAREALRSGMAIPEPTWSGRSAGNFFFGSVISDAAGRQAGAVVVEYSGAEAKTAGWAMAGQLATAGVLFAALASVFAAALLRLGVRREIRAFEDIGRDIAGYQRRSWRDAFTAREATEGRDTDLAVQLAEAERAYRQAMKRNRHGPREPS